MINDSLYRLVMASIIAKNNSDSSETGTRPLALEFGSSDLSESDRSLN